MLKRVIFDVDDTLIPWKKSYYRKLKKVLNDNDIKISWLILLKVLKTIEEYERTHNNWNIEEFKDCISKVSKIKMDDAKISLFFKWLEDCVDEAASDELLQTLEYLSKKYELVILSNSFKKAQTIRIEKYGIKKYFKEIYCGDEFMKPNKIAYERACGNHKAAECIMIGDNLQFDVIEPINFGLSAIYVNKKKHKKYETIKKISELKNIL